MYIADKLKVVKPHYTRRIAVYWGGYSMVKAELILIQAALAKHYDYLHLLSGSDLPIQSHENIEEFFIDNKGKEFIHFGSEQYQQDIVSRYNKYHFLQRHFRNLTGIWNKIETYSLAIQRRLKISRSNYMGCSIYGGANWFSITEDLARYVLSQKRMIHNVFRFAQNPDEMFLQTIAMNSEFKDRLYMPGFLDDCRQNMRYVDWKGGCKGGPKIITLDDYAKLKNSRTLFARKFDAKIDKCVIENILIEK